MPIATESGRDMVVNGVDVELLSDEELFQRLKDLGVEVGPIVGSTRSVYQRKLYHLLKGDHYHTDSDQNNSRHSQSENEMDTMTTTQRRVSRAEEHHHQTSTKQQFASSPPSSTKKDSSFFVSCFEIVMLTLLAIIGYIFIQEIRAYSAFETEFEESHAQNIEG